MTPETKIHFFTVKDAQTKIQALIQTVSLHFSRKEKLQIVASDQATLDFVDQLLWKEPKEGFFPHSVEAALPFQDLLFISFPVPDLDPYPFVFNLSISPYPISPSLKILYELEDISHPQKSAIFSAKFKHYQQLGCILCSQDINATC